MPININEIEEVSKYKRLIDYKIMKLLKENPETAFFAFDLSKELDDSEDTIRIRIRVLEKEGLLIKTKIASKIAVYYKSTKNVLVLKKERGRETLSVAKSQTND